MSTTTPDAPPGRCLLVGAGGVGKRALAAALTGGDLAEGASQAAWALHTKYYTAGALLQLCRPEASLLLQGEAAPPGLEAVVLVFDAAREGSWQAVRAWYEAAGGADAPDLGVRLAVGVDSSGGGESGPDAAPRPAWMDGVEEWCAEQLVELIEAAAPGGAAAAAPATSGAGGQGAVGVARVREALEAHMWPGLRLKPTPQRGGAAAAAEQQDAPPAGASAAAGEAGARGAAAAAGPAAPQQQQQVDVEDAVPAANGTQPAAAQGGEDEAEGEVEQLEKLFAQVASHRATLAQLPDAQRREAAAAVVMQLMQAMGLEEDDEEEGEDGGDER